MSQATEARNTLQDRVSTYLGGNPERRNSFVAAAETARAIEEAGVCDVNLNETLSLMEQARQDLQAAQEKVYRLQRVIDAQRR